MQKWPDQWETVSYDDLIEPIKSIFTSGYYYSPKDHSGFEYNGFNIGKNELRIVPNPKKRLTKDGLQEESKQGRTLVDTLFHITFLLGVEQGRRVETCNRHSVKSIVDTLDTYKRTISTLRHRNDEVEALLKAKTSNPNASQAELTEIVNKELTASRSNRIALAKKDANSDPTKKPTEKQSGSRASFKELKRAAKMVENKITLEVWTNYLNECQWSLDDWYRKCVKEDFNPSFL